MSRSRWKITRARHAGSSTPPEQQRPVIVSYPVIEEVAEVGVPIYITGDIWDNGVTSKSYKWYAGNQVINGATSNPYTPVIADTGKVLKGEVVASNSAGASEPAQSNATDPVINSVTPDAIYFGDKTRRGHGGADIGLSGTLSISSGNTGSVWAIDSNNLLVIAGTYGAAPPAMSYPYTLVISNGSTTKTVDVLKIDNAYSVRPNPGDSGTTNQIHAVLNSGTVNYGDHIVQRDGTTFGLNASGNINDAFTTVTVQIGASIVFGVRSGGPSAPTHQGWSAPGYSGTTHEHPGWVTLRPETPFGATMTNIDFNTYSRPEIYVKIEQMNYRCYNIAGTSGSTTAAIKTRSDGGVSSTRWLAVVNCDIQSRMESGTPASTKIASGIYLKQTGSASNFYIYNNFIGPTYNGIIRSGDIYEIVGNEIPYNYNDAVKGVATKGLNTWNIVYNKAFIGSAHGDYFQEQWYTVPAGTYEGSVYIGNIMFIGDHGGSGQVGGQGVFISGGSTNGAYITGVVIKGNLYVDAMVRGISVSNAIEPDVQHNVIVKDQSDTYPVGTPTIAFGGTTGGVAKNNVIATSSSSGPATILLESVVSAPTQTGNYAVANADVNAAYNAPVFGPGYTLQQIREAFTSKVGGPLDSTPDKGLGIGTNYVDFVNRTTNFPA